MSVGSFALLAGVGATLLATGIVPLFATAAPEIRLVQLKHAVGRKLSGARAEHFHARETVVTEDANREATGLSFRFGDG